MGLKKKMVKTTESGLGVSLLFTDPDNWWRRGFGNSIMEPNLYFCRGYQSFSLSSTFTLAKLLLFAMTSDDSLPIPLLSFHGTLDNGPVPTLIFP